MWRSIHARVAGLGGSALGKWNAHGLASVESYETILDAVLQKPGHSYADAQVQPKPTSLRKCTNLHTDAPPRMKVQPKDDRTHSRTHSAMFITIPRNSRNLAELVRAFVKKSAGFLSVGT